MNGNNLVLIVAGGKGSRMNSTIPKQYLKIGEKTVILRAIEAFLKNSCVDFVKVVISETHLPMYNQIISNIDDRKLLPVALGGKSRTESVFNGLNSFDNICSNRANKVLIHDAARPFVSQNLIVKLFDELEIAEAVFPKLPISDALWYQKKKYFSKGPSRDFLFRAQTPQGFYFEQIKNLCAKNCADHLDDISIAHENMLRISSIPGDPLNIKLTNPEDLGFAERLAKVWT